MSLTDVIIKMLGVLECPVCFEYVTPPVMQCVEGHILCGTCREKLNSCPSCEKEFCNIRIRSLDAIAEAMLYPCRNEGCDLLLNLSDRTRHENQCTFPKSMDENETMQNNILRNIEGTLSEFVSHNKKFSKQVRTRGPAKRQLPADESATAGTSGLKIRLPKSKVPRYECSSSSGSSSEADSLNSSTDSSEVEQQIGPNLSEDDYLPEEYYEVYNEEGDESSCHLVDVTIGGEVENDQLESDDSSSY